MYVCIHLSIQHYCLYKYLLAAYMCVYIMYENENFVMQCKRNTIFKKKRQLKNDINNNMFNKTTLIRNQLNNLSTKLNRSRPKIVVTFPIIIWPKFKFRLKWKSIEKTKKKEKPMKIQ